MKLFLAILTGLQPNSYANARGMRAIADQFEAEAKAAGHEVVRYHLDWKEDGTPKTPDSLCRILRDKIVAEEPRIVILMGHSFGAALLLFFLQWLHAHFAHAMVQVCVNLALFYDLAVNPINFGDDKGRWVPPEVAPRVVSFHQHNGKPALICGWPVAPREGVTNHDVSRKTLDGQRVGHTSLISHPDVIAASLAAMREVLK